MGGGEFHEFFEYFMEKWNSKGKFLEIEKKKYDKNIKFQSFKKNPREEFEKSRKTLKKTQKN